MTVHVRCFKYFMRKDNHHFTTINLKLLPDKDKQIFGHYVYALMKH